MRRNGIEDFWSKVQKSSGCWLWLRAKDEDGYGLFNYQGRMWRATRFVLQIVLGQDIDGKLVRHKCDNPPCVNPAHLLVGSSLENSADRDNRGRGLRGRKQSAEHVANKADARRGKKWTPEMKESFSRLTKERLNP